MPLTAREELAYVNCIAELEWQFDRCEHQWELVSHQWEYLTLDCIVCQVTMNETQFQQFVSTLWATHPSIFRDVWMKVHAANS